MDVSDLESIIKTHPLLFISLAACTAYVAACSVRGYLEKKKKEETNCMLEDPYIKSVYDERKADK